MTRFLRRRTWLLAIASIAVTGLGQSPAVQSATPNVVATNAILCDLTKQVAQETIRLTCLMKPGQDPHTYQLTPADRRALEEAQLILYGGYSYEPALEKAIRSTDRSPTKVAVFEQAVPKPLMSKGHHHDDDKPGQPHAHQHSHGGHSHGGHSHAGHSHGGHSHDQHAHDAADPLTPDPHVWHDARNGARIVDTLRKQLTALSPKETARYIRRSQAVIAEMNQLDTWIHAQIKTIPPDRRVLITTHDGLGYYTNAYGLKLESALGAISTEEQASATQLKTVINLVRQVGIPVVFAETTSNPRLVQTLAREANVRVSEQPLVVDSLGEPGSSADTYQKMLVHNTCSIVNGLGGTCKPK